MKNKVLALAVLALLCQSPAEAGILRRAVKVARVAVLTPVCVAKCAGIVGVQGTKAFFYILTMDLAEMIERGE